MTGKADWGFVTQQGKIIGVYSQSTLPPFKKVGFDLADVSLSGAKSYKEWIFSTSLDNNVNGEEDAAKSQQKVEAVVNESLVNADNKTDQVRPGVRCIEHDCRFYSPKYDPR